LLSVALITREGSQSDEDGGGEKGCGIEPTRQEGYPPLDGYSIKLREGAKQCEIQNRGEKDAIFTQDMPLLYFVPVSAFLSSSGNDRLIEGKVG